MKPWKELEKEVARRLDGTRVIRERWDKSDCDVRHQCYSIECKFRGDIGAFYNEELDRMRLYGHTITADGRKPSKFIIEALKQARDYCPTKPALLVVKRKGLKYEDALVFMHATEFPVTRVKHVILWPLAFTGLREFANFWEKNKYHLMPVLDPKRYEG